MSASHHEQQENVGKNQNKLLAKGGGRLAKITMRIDNSPPGYAAIKSGLSEDYLLDKLDDEYGPKGICYYIKAAALIFFGSAGCLAMAFICMVVPPSMIVMGALNLYKCPVEPYIPIFLIVCGTFAILSTVLGFIVRIRMSGKDDSPRENCDKCLLSISNLIHCFTIAWFIAGCTWVYGVYQPSFEPQMGLAYCDGTAYLFAFWLLNSVFILFGVILLAGFIMLLISLVSPARRIDDF